jgi:hypothetical protein
MELVYDDDYDVHLHLALGSLKRAEAVLKQNIKTQGIGSGETPTWVKALHYVRIAKKIVKDVGV